MSSGSLNKKPRFIPPTKTERENNNQKFSVIDAHNRRVQIKNNHPDRPTLTAWALSILFPEEVDNNDQDQ